MSLLIYHIPYYDDMTDLIADVKALDDERVGYFLEKWVYHDFRHDFDCGNRIYGGELLGGRPYFIRWEWMFIVNYAVGYYDNFVNEFKSKILDLLPRHPKLVRVFLKFCLGSADVIEQLYEACLKINDEFDQLLHALINMQVRPSLSIMYKIMDKCIIFSPFDTPDYCITDVIMKDEYYSSVVHYAITHIEDCYLTDVTWDKIKSDKMQAVKESVESGLERHPIYDRAIWSVVRKFIQIF